MQNAKPRARDKGAADTPKTTRTHNDYETPEKKAQNWQFQKSRKNKQQLQTTKKIEKKATTAQENDSKSSELVMVWQCTGRNLGSNFEYFLNSFRKKSVQVPAVGLLSWGLSY